jgi:TetR/AcrR family transcriptional regulator
MQNPVAAATVVSPASLNRSRMRAEQRRQHFIDTALHLFSTRGFRGTTTKAIAEAAGVSEALLFRYFPTKADLYGAILQQKARQAGFDAQLETFRRQAKRGDDWRLVHDVVRTIFARYEGDPDFERLMLYAALEGHELASISRQRFGRPTFALLRDYVVQRQQAGVFRRGDPALLVFGLVALPAYFAMAQRLWGLEVAATSDRTAADLFTQIVLDGLRVHADDPVDRSRRHRRDKTAER